MKYIDADKLKYEIERRKLSNYYTDTDDYEAELFEIIDFLQQEQPDVNLKKEIKEWTDLMVGTSFPEQDGAFISEEDFRSVIRQTAIHFLDLNARKKE